MLGYWGNPRGYCCKSSTKTRDKNTKNWIANCENRKCAHTPSALTKRRDKPAKMVATNRYFNIFFCLTIFIRNIFCYVSNAQDIGIGLLLRAQAHVCTTNTVTPHHHHLLVGRAVAIGNNNIAAGARVSCSPLPEMMKIIIYQHQQQFYSFVLHHIFVLIIILEKLNFSAPRTK